ncbi:metallophosphoesterase [Acidianus sp. RZ1]|uniref:metallophosphoesterase n=1 Tax=Acidianus sp. RZ1 TaxID=1540082 RepID=UPI0014932401|nr:metallophosphoesterase [Acidianus sp. RZ1]NON63160.1 serine/threonine protein phosphatase [Acidianus sp. RZ1]
MSTVNSKEEVIKLLDDAYSLFKSLPTLIELPNKPRVLFVGDTHGADDVTRKVFSEFSDKVDLIIFIGDYVDRGVNGVENLTLILSRALQEKDKVIVLRGNHESPLTNEYYGFKNEVSKKLGEDIYENFVRTFSIMPLAAVVNGYFCVHGGIARGLHSLDQVNAIQRPDVNPDNEIAFEMLWNDPREELDGFVPNIRGEGTYFYGKDVTLKFIEDNNLLGIIRAHEVADGFRFEMDNKVITVFSSRYHGMRAGALLLNNNNLETIFL